MALHKHKAKECCARAASPRPRRCTLTTPGRRTASVDHAVPADRQAGARGRLGGHLQRIGGARPRRPAPPCDDVMSQYRQPALVERYIEGREIYVSMLGRPTVAPQILPVLRDRLLGDAGRSAAHRVVRGQVGRGVGRVRRGRSPCCARAFRPSCRPHRRRRAARLRGHGGPRLRAPGRATRRGGADAERPTSST